MSSRYVFAADDSVVEFFSGCTSESVRNFSAYSDLWPTHHINEATGFRRDALAVNSK